MLEIDIASPISRVDIYRYSVSVVLNVHREGDYLRPTLMSLDECANFAKKRQLYTELVVVFDKSDQRTIDVFTSTHLSGFESIKSIEVELGSLGLARNCGISAAEGEYIWTADGDDLASENSIVELEATARAEGSNETAVFMEYCIGFGQKHYVARYERSSILTAADFAFTHPYVSRVFAKKALFAENPYLDLRLTRGFAFEDWDFNARLFARKIKFSVARGTILFYRHRPDSLLQQANNTSARIIPHSNLFEPQVFLSLMKAKRLEIPDWDRFLDFRRDLAGTDLTKDLLGRPELRKFIRDAAKIDPEIDPPNYESASSYCPIPWRQNHWGFLLESVFELIGQKKFSDILLLPWLNAGGAEKYILSILDKLQGTQRQSRILVLTGQRAERHDWRCRLGSDFVFLDLYNAFPELDTESRDQLTARLILSTAEKGARLHAKPSEFSHRFLDRFGSALADEFMVVYYRFSDPRTQWRGSDLRTSWASRFLRRNAGCMSLILSDCEYILSEDVRLMPSLSTKVRCVRAECTVRRGSKMPGTTPKYRLLWASRVSEEKRPRLILPLARALNRVLPSLRIDVFGYLSGGISLREIADGISVNYRGSFNTFESLPLDEYDALLYTSAYDGMPNVVLEAMISGLSVVAPNVGGIPEAVGPDTGFLVDDCDDARELIDRYVEKIKLMFDDWPETLLKRRNAQRLIAERHSRKSTISSTLEAFGLLNLASPAGTHREDGELEVPIFSVNSHQMTVDDDEFQSHQIDGSTVNRDIMTHTAKFQDADQSELIKRIEELEGQIVARDERITELGNLLHSAGFGRPSSFKAFLVRVWDGLPSGIQKRVEPLANYIDKAVR